MTKELTTYNDDEYIREAQEAGLYVPKSEGTWTPRLAIQTEPYDHEDNAVPRGTYTVMDPATGVRVYAETVKFRPYVKRNQYSIYDQKNKVYTNRSMLFSSWAESILDEQGGERCGKVVGKDKKQLTAAEVEAQAKIKLACRVWGTVTMDGVDKDKNKVHVEAAPCELKLQGTNYTTLDECFKIVTAAKRLPYNFEFNLSLKKNMNPSGKARYNVVASIDDPSGSLSLNGAEQDIKRDFTKMINDENAAIRLKYAAVHEKRVSDMEDKTIIDAEFDDMDDDISDLGVKTGTED